jgi:hypothetical protein
MRKQMVPSIKRYSVMGDEKAEKSPVFLDLGFRPFVTLAQPRNVDKIVQHYIYSIYNTLKA